MRHFIERTVHDRINLPARIVVKPDAASPYARYGKREYQYSPRYYAWRRSITGKAANAEKVHAQTGG